MKNMNGGAVDAVPGNGGLVDFFIATKEILRAVEWSRDTNSVADVGNAFGKNTGKEVGGSFGKNTGKEVGESFGKNFGMNVADMPSGKIFNTVQLDTGQFGRLTSKVNTEYGLVLPAAFIRFDDIVYESVRQLVARGTAKMRILVVLNRLDNLADGPDCEGFYVVRRVIEAMQEGQRDYPTVACRLSLNTFEQGKEFSQGVQHWYIYYKVSFREVSSLATTLRTKATMVMPPFTNHADQDPTLPDVNPEHHNNLDHKRSYDEASGYDIPTLYVPSGTKESSL